MKGVLAAVVIIAALGVVGYIYLPRQVENKSEIETASKTVQKSSLPKSESKYIEYSEGVLERTSESNRILFFYANWCPTCRPVDKEIMESESEIPNGYLVIRVNYNDTDTDKEEEVLADKYGVTYQHTFIEIDKNGEVIQSWNGGDFATLLSKITR